MHALNACHQMKRGGPGETPEDLAGAARAYLREKFLRVKARKCCIMDLVVLEPGLGPKGLIRPNRDMLRCSQ